MSLKMITSDRRLWPLFWTQLLGALGDNLFKNALILIVTYRGATAFGLTPGQIVALASGLFVLPFILFSPLAGQVADRVPKARLARQIKWAELVVFVVAAWGLFRQDVAVLLLGLLLAGVQASWFGPVKYSLLPEQVRGPELVSANAYIEMGTFIAILAGTVLGGLLVQAREVYLVLSLFCLAALGIWTSRQIVEHPAAAPTLALDRNPWTGLIDLIRLARRDRAIWWVIIAISWFWAYGAVVLSVIPLFGKTVLNVDESVVTAFLAVFTIGIGLGGFLGAKLSFGRTELGLSPFGALGMSLFLADVCRNKPDWDSSWPINLTRFLGTHVGPRLIGDLFLISLSAGIFILPLYTYLQERAPAAVRARVIAANNVVNAVFMVLGSLAVMALGGKITWLLLGLAVANILVLILLARQLPDLHRRGIGWLLARAVHRVRVRGENYVPKTGPALLVANARHRGDWRMLSVLVPRDLVFAEYDPEGFAVDGPLIPICGRADHAEILAQAFERIATEFRAGHLVCVLPRVRGQVDEEVGRLLTRHPVTVVPLSFTFSAWRRGRLCFGAPLKPERATSAELARILDSLTKGDDHQL